MLRRAMRVGEIIGRKRTFRLITSLREGAPDGPAFGGVRKPNNVPAGSKSCLVLAGGGYLSRFEIPSTATP